jgi:predicted dehydrogenase
MTVGVALIGAGYWGPNLARNLVATDGAELRVICDASKERLARMGKAHPGARLEVDAAAVWAAQDIDAVVIATPVDTHHGLARQALEAGKHILVEKPLARSSTECRDLIDLASRQERVLMVGHVFLFNPSVRQVKDYIDADEIGDIQYAYSQRLNLGQVRPDVNALWNFAPHDLSILRYWFGADPERVMARGFAYVRPDVEDVVFMTLDYPGGIGANVHVSWLDPLKLRRMTIVGSKKMIVYDDVSADARIAIYDKGVTRQALPADSPTLGPFESFAEFQVLLRAGDVLIPHVDFVEPLKAECQHFVDCIRTGAAPMADGESGLAVVLALEAAQASLASGQAERVMTADAR